MQGASASFFSPYDYSYFLCFHLLYKLLTGFVSRGNKLGFCLEEIVAVATYQSPAKEMPIYLRTRIHIHTPRYYTLHSSLLIFTFIRTWSLLLMRWKQL